MEFPHSTSLDYRLINNIAKSYSTLDYAQKLRGMLDQLFPRDTFDKCRKYDLHRKINEVVFDGYEGEQVLKYRLFEAFRQSDLVGAYEIKVRNSRVDFLTINGHTTSFEIKSNLDNLYKLEKQANDYMQAFELNNVVIHERHLEKCIGLIPGNFGIITTDREGHAFYRKPVLNRNLDTQVQLSLLTKRELKKFMASPDTTSIMDSISPEEINSFFKLALKERYRSRWDFVVRHSKDILPIDLQFFFNKNIRPEYNYS